MRSKSIYLDNATIARPTQMTIGKMLPYLSEEWASSSSPHQLGQRLHSHIKEGYQALYSLLGADHQATIIFTSSGAEAVNHLIHGVFHDVTRVRGKNHFLTAQTDEAPAILTVGRLEKMGCVGKMIPVDESGQLTLDAISDALSPRTALISLSWGNGLTGMVQPVHEIVDLCRERGVLVHLEASHILGKHFFDLDDLPVDFITFDGGTLHAPRGTGALYVRKSLTLSPFILGGGQQGGQRGGETDVAGLMGLASASRELLESADLIATETVRLRDQLEKGVKSSYPEAEILFEGVARLPHISVIAFPGVSNEALLYALSEQGVYATMGGGVFQQISLILSAMGFPDSLCQSALSFALSRTTFPEEIDRAVELIAQTAKQLRCHSKYLIES